MTARLVCKFVLRLRLYRRNVPRMAHRKLAGARDCCVRGRRVARHKVILVIE